MEMKEQLYILAIGRHKNIKDAAQELCVTSSALSIFVSNLENHIGIRLFNRIGKQFLPTEAGELYLRRARQMMDIRDRYEDELSLLKNQASGHITFGIQPRRTLHLLAPAIAEFSPGHPGIRITPKEQSAAETMEELINGTLDFAITNRYAPHRYLTWEMLYQDQLVVILPADHPAAAQAVTLPGQPAPWLNLKLLEDEIFILQRPFQAIHDFEMQALRYADVTPKESYCIENLEAAAQMAAEGCGIAFNFIQFARHFRYPKPTRYFLVGDPDTLVNYYIVKNHQRYTPSYVDEFIHILQNHL